jgi:hypothetical protein
MTQAEKHNFENRDRLLRGLVENDPVFKAFKVVEVTDAL